MEDRMESEDFKKEIFKHLTIIESLLMYIALNQIKYANVDKSPEMLSYIREQYEGLSKVVDDLMKENNS